MSQLLEDLQAVRRKIEDPEHWTSWAFARDRYGRPVGPRDSTAVSYCIYGAMGVVAGVTTTKRFVALSDCILPICPDPGWVNDTHGHAAILAVLDLAINLEKDPLYLSSSVRRAV